MSFCNCFRVTNTTASTKQLQGKPIIQQSHGTSQGSAPPQKQLQLAKRADSQRVTGPVVLASDKRESVAHFKDELD